MKLIDFQGLNCYQNALITIAAFMGADYKRAFINLWPETDFDYDSDHKVYLTKRMLQNLEALGIKQERFRLASASEAREALSRIDFGTPFLVGMDTFHIPWSPGFGIVHDMHYFAACKEPPGRLICFDPTYSTQHTASDAIASFFSTIHRIDKVGKRTLLPDACRAEIPRCLPLMQSRLLDEMDKCAHEKDKNTLLMAKYVDALISNRYLYKYYLDNTPLSPAPHQPFFDKSFFARWNAVKNGLYKAFVVKDNEDIMDEVSALFKSLIDEEIAVAANA